MSLYIPPEPKREPTPVETTAKAIAAWLEETIGARASKPLTQCSRTSILITTKDGRRRYLSFESEKLHVEQLQKIDEDTALIARTLTLDYNDPGFPDRLIQLLQGRTEQQTAADSQENET